MSNKLTQYNLRLYLWWQTIDRVSFTIIVILLLYSLLAVSSASYALAARINIDPSILIKRHLCFVGLSLGLLCYSSTFEPKFLAKIAPPLFLLILGLLLATLLLGTPIKGARRWLDIAGFSLQASEFLKPIFCLYNGVILAMAETTGRWQQNFIISLLLLVIIAILLILQPDFGMLIEILLIWSGQIFIAGLAKLWIYLSIFGALIISVLAYKFLPHVAYRIESFFSAQSNYQVSKSLASLQNGGWFGTGLGSGDIKYSLPDAHADFIFAVIIEEMGFIQGLLLIILLSTVILRGLLRILKNPDKFAIYTSLGLLLHLGLQMLINIGVNLNLLPTKGMTLPFLSYGGSSMLACTLAAGLIIALNRVKLDENFWQLQQYRRNRQTFNILSKR